MLVLLSLLALGNAQLNENQLSVKTTQGVVVGRKAQDGDYYAFNGIPYGGPTSGENRFKAPTPAPTFEKDFQAVDDKAMCSHAGNAMFGFEDCLFLHISTPNNIGSRPVVVLLDGKEYASTRIRLITFNQLVKQDIVVVKINYRLSIFGFLCLGVPEAPGNAGLKDVIQALQWIKKNIAAFGGDPNNVILLGNGSGAAMADLITLSPLSQNLVHKVFAISGSALSPWAVAYDPIGFAEKLAKKLSLGGKSRSELAKALASTDKDTLISAINEFEFYNNAPFFGPCIENTDLKDRVLTDAPVNILQNGNYNQVPYVAAFVDREGILRAGPASYKNWLEKMDANFTDFIQVDLKFESEQNKMAVAQSIREFYFAQKAINKDTIENFLDYEGDTLVLVSVIRSIAKRAASSRSPVRLLEFAYRTTDKNREYPNIRVNGAGHGDLYDYLVDFDYKYRNASILQESLLNRIAAFARTGDPNPSNGGSAVKWNAYTPNDPVAFRISGEGTVTTVNNMKEEAKVNIHKQKMDFWNDIYNRYYRLPQAVDANRDASPSSAAKLFSLSFILIVTQFIIKMF